MVGMESDLCCLSGVLIPARTPRRRRQAQRSALFKCNPFLLKGLLGKDFRVFFPRIFGRFQRPYGWAFDPDTSLVEWMKLNNTMDIFQRYWYRIYGRSISSDVLVQQLPHILNYIIIYNYTNIDKYVRNCHLTCMIQKIVLRSLCKSPNKRS